MSRIGQIQLFALDKGRIGQVCLHLASLPCPSRGHLQGRWPTVRLSITAALPLFSHKEFLIHRLIFFLSLPLSHGTSFVEAKSCEDIQCSTGKKCLWDFKVGRGRCALCDELCPESKSDEAVCASDNTTYPSECAMKEAACSLGVLLEVKHSGSCNCK